MMNVDQRTVDLGEELRRKDLHVSGQHHQIRVSAQQVELAPLCFHPIILGRRHMEEWHGKRAYLIGEIGMVGYHHRDRHVELTATIAPQQIEQAVVFLGRHDCDAFWLRGLGQPEVYIEPRGHLITEIPFEGVSRGRQSRQVEYRSLHERAARLLGGVLIQRHDVGARSCEECTYRRDQSGSIGTAQQEPAYILDWQTPGTYARVPFLHVLQGVTPRRLRSQNLHMLRRSRLVSAP